MGSRLPATSAAPPAVSSSRLTAATVATVASASPASPVVPLVISNRVAGQFEVRANVQLELATKAEVETQAADGSWKAYSDLDGGQGYRLRESCSEIPPACRTLAAGEQLSLAAWTGSSCSAQCAVVCGVDRFHPGVHRLVLHACEPSKTRYEGPAFDMAPSARELWRWRAAAGIRRGQVFRLEPHTLAKEPKDGPPEYIAGFRVIKDSGHPLAPELLVELAEWLRSRDGFVQLDLHKRCLQWTVVGLLLEVDAPRPEQRTVELALNLGCGGTVFITTSDGRGRITEASHFDPSWTRLISIVRRALPLDAEIAGLRGAPAPRQ